VSTSPSRYARSGSTVAGQDETARGTEADQPGQAERAHRREQAEARGGQPETASVLQMRRSQASAASSAPGSARAAPDDQLVHVFQRCVRTLV
jgi:hypothetical protein